MKSAPQSEHCNVLSDSATYRPPRFVCKRVLCPPTHTICMIRELCAPLRTLFEHIIYPFVLFATFFARMVKILRIDYEKKKKIRENVLISIMVADSRHTICLKL